MIKLEKHQNLVLLISIGAILQPIEVGCSVSESEVLRRDSAEEETWFLPTSDDCVLFVRERGDGPLVVVLHGGPGHSHDVLLNAFDRLENEYRFVFYDQRGTLYSPCDESKVTHQQNVQDLEILRKTLGIGKLTLVAHSAGALLALSYMEKFPDRVAHAVLVTAPAFRYPKPSEDKLGEPVINTGQHDEIISKSFRNQLKVEGLLKGYEENSLSVKELNTVSRIYFAANFLYDLRNWKQLRGGGVFHNPNTEAAIAKTIPDPWDYSVMLQNFSGSVSVINAKNDYRVNAQLWNHIKLEVSGMRYIEIENAGHALWIDQPEKFYQALKSVLNRPS